MDVREKNLLYKKIASMIVVGTPDVQVAQACALNASQIGAIKQDEIFVAILQQEQEKTLGDNEKFNSGWDGVEREALKNLKDVMKFNKNPDWLLKVAVQANTAKRRMTSPGNQTLNGGLQKTVILNLTQNFVQRLNDRPLMNGHALELTADKGEHSIKKTDIVSPGLVERILTGRQDETEEMAALRDLNIELSVDA